MPAFKGFPDGKTPLIPLPEPFFSELLPQIEHLGELKLALHIFWLIEQMEGAFRFVSRSGLEQDSRLQDSLGGTGAAFNAALDEALLRLVTDGVLLEAQVPTSGGSETCCFLNSPRGRAALRAIQSGEWRPFATSAAATAPRPPNIFELYEQNIGPLTPMIADALGEAQDAYPAQWIEDAIRIAVEKNKRNWRYVVAILERWQKEGRHGRKEKPQDRPDSPEAGRKYVEGEYSEFIKH
jgi:DNA replication protein